MDLETLENEFEVERRFRARKGPAYDTPGHSQKKLCLVATDKAHLVELLWKASQRSDCVYVKYTPEPTDGMYLGRVFFVSADEVGREWARLKRDPKVLCSVQDDDFTLPFREL